MRTFNYAYKYRLVAARKPQMDSAKLIQDLINLKPGEKVVYFVGFLDINKTEDPKVRPAIIASRLAQEGKIHLTQRRLGLPNKEGETDWLCGVGPGFEYIAIGASRRKR